MKDSSQPPDRLQFGPDGNLPSGVHEMKWSEFVAKFASTRYRRSLVKGLAEAAKALKRAGCKRIWVDGSFVTTKRLPGDFDACWDLEDVDLPELRRIAPTFFNFDNQRAAQKAEYGGEFFPAQLTEGASGVTFLEFFQVDKQSGMPKGIVAIDLESLDS